MQALLRFATTWDRTLPARRRTAALWLFALALAIHLLYLSQYALSPFFAEHRLDALYNHRMAQQMLHGTLPQAPFFRAPLYSGFLAGVYTLLGDGPWGPRLLQSILGSASVVLTFAIGLRWFRPCAALLGAALTALYGPLVYHNNELHTPALEVFLDLLALWLLPNRPGASGLILGLSALARPNALLGLLPFGIWLARRRGVRPATLFALAALLAPAAVTVRNLRVSGDPVFIASQGGINLFLGNRPQSDGYTPSTPTRYRFESEYEDSVELYGRRAADEAAGRHLSASEANRYWMGQAGAFWRERPGDAAALTGRKLLLTLGARERRNNTAFEYMRAEWTPLLWAAPISFGILGPLGLLGLALGARGRSPLAGFIVLYLAGIVAFFAADRYRLPLVPLLALFAGHGLVALLTDRGRWARVALLIGLAILVNVDWTPRPSPTLWAQDEGSAGNRLASAGRLPEAEARLHRAIALDPGDAELWGKLGEVFYRQDRLGDATAAWANAAQRAPYEASYVFNAAQALQQLGRKAEARGLLEEALRREPGYERARHALASL